MTDITALAVDLDAALQYVDAEWDASRKDYGNYKYWNDLAIKVHQFLGQAQVENLTFKRWNGLAIQTHLFIGMVHDLVESEASGGLRGITGLTSEKWKALTPMLHGYAGLAHDKLADPGSTDFKKWNDLAQQTLRYLGVAVEPTFSVEFKEWIEMEQLLLTYLELVHEKLSEANAKKSTITARGLVSGATMRVQPMPDQAATLVKAFHRISQYIDRLRSLHPIFSPEWWTNEKDFRAMNKLRESIANRYESPSIVGEPTKKSTELTPAEEQEYKNLEWELQTGQLPGGSQTTATSSTSSTKKTSSPFATMSATPPAPSSTTSATPKLVFSFGAPPAKAKMPAWA